MKAINNMKQQTATGKQSGYFTPIIRKDLCVEVLCRTMFKLISERWSEVRGSQAWSHWQSILG